jgi:hypothetical protein
MVLQMLLHLCLNLILHFFTTSTDSPRRMWVPYGSYPNFSNPRHISAQENLTFIPNVKKLRLKFKIIWSRLSLMILKLLKDSTYVKGIHADINQIILTCGFKPISSQMHLYMDEIQTSNKIFKLHSINSIKKQLRLKLL